MTDAMRAAFEAQAKEMGYSTRRITNQWLIDGYEADPLNGAWLFWQAAYESSEAEVQRLREELSLMIEQQEKLNEKKYPFDSTTYGHGYDNGILMGLKVARELIDDQAITPSKGR